MSKTEQKIERLADAVLRDQSNAWNWLDMDNGDERSDDAIIKITDSAGRIICSATAGWLKAVSLYPPSDEAPEEPSGDEQRSILSLTRRVTELDDENGRLKAQLRATASGEGSVAKDAARWRKLMDCERFRFIGSGALGEPYAHISIELWGKYASAFDPNADAEARAAFHRFIDGLSE